MVYRELVEDCGCSDHITVIVKSYRWGEGEAEDVTAEDLESKSNLSDVDCCATRLRVTVIDSERVDDALLKQSGASGVIHKGNGVQVIP